METSQIIAGLNAEIARLQQVRMLLTGGNRLGNGRVVGRPKNKRTFSAEARARMAAAQRKRWAKQKA